WQAARTEHRLDAPAIAAATQKQALRRGMALSLTNPQNLAYWAAMGSALGAVGVAQPGASDYGVFFAGFMTSSLLWCFVCAALVDRLFRRAAAHWSRFTYRCCAALLLALALGTLRDLLGTNPAALPPAAQQQSLR
ncbi:LysE family transporter, partial [Comamonas thiooxydans]